MKPNSKNAGNENVDPLETTDWSTEDEVKLFYALRNHKPVGVNRHFEMLFVHEEFCRLIKRDIDSKVIWKHLETLYDMETLHENEDLPFSNNEMDFDLSNDFDDLKKQKLADRIENDSISSEQTNEENSQSYPYRSKSSSHHQDTATTTTNPAAANNTSFNNTTTTTPVTMTVISHHSLTTSNSGSTTTTGGNLSSSLHSNVSTPTANKGKANKSEDRRETRETRETSRDDSRDTTKTPKNKRNKSESKTDEKATTATLSSTAKSAKKRRSQNI